MNFDDLDRYNGNTRHDMWVDNTYNVYTGELRDFSDNNGNISRRSNPQPAVAITLNNPRKKLKRYRRKIASLQSKIDEDKKLIHDIDCKNQKSEPTPKLLKRYRIQKQIAEYDIEKNSKKLVKLQGKVPSLEAAIIHENNKSITVITVVLTCGIIFLFLMLLTTIIEV